MITYVTLVVVGGLALRWAFRASRPRSLRLRREALWVGVGLMALGPALVWPLGHGPAILVGLAAFALGWLMSWGSLNPGGSFLRGVALGAILYVTIGIGWSVGFNRPDGPLDLLWNGSSDVIGWPLSMSVVLNLFGLELN